MTELAPLAPFLFIAGAVALIALAIKTIRFVQHRRWQRMRNRVLGQR